MTLQQIMYFHEIARVQSFTQAAQNLFVAQSGLSYAIQSLEKEIGVPLFIRKSGKKVLLTSYGEAFLPYAQQVLSNLREGQDAIARMKDPNNGVVTVAYSYANCFSLISTLFRDFYTENSYDNISVRFSINQNRSRFEHDVAAGELDLAFSCTPSFDGVESVSVAKQELFLMVPAQHRLASRDCVSFDEIRDEVFFGYYQNWNLSNWVSKMFEEAGIRQNVLEYFPDWATQMGAVAMGLGLAISPRLPVDPSFIRTLPLDHPGRFRDIYLHWAKNRELSDSVQYVRRYCLDYCRTKPLIF